MNSSTGHAIRWGRSNQLALIGENPVPPDDVFYTPRALAQMCVSLVPIQPGDVVLDPCSGDGAFRDVIPGALECEISRGTDFYGWEDPVDWCVSNPPYSDLDNWLAHSCDVSRKGFAYLLGWNNLTAKRIQRCEMRGFGISSVTMFKVFQWFGMSAFIVWERGADGIIGYDRTVWK